LWLWRSGVTAPNTLNFFACSGLFPCPERGDKALGPTLSIFDANQGLKINREKREKKDFLAYFAASVLL
jgi:hypothetical protein